MRGACERAAAAYAAAARTERVAGLFGHIAGPCPARHLLSLPLDVARAAQWWRTRSACVLALLRACCFVTLCVCAGVCVCVLCVQTWLRVLYVLCVCGCSHVAAGPAAVAAFSTCRQLVPHECIRLDWHCA